TSSSPPMQTHVLAPATLDYLSSLPRPILDGLLRILKSKSYAAGETIWKQGKEGDVFGIVVQGKVQSRRVETIQVPLVHQAPAASGQPKEKQRTSIAASPSRR